MKKILSFILALTLCIGLLPTFVFAAEAEEFTFDLTAFQGLSEYKTNQYWMGNASNKTGTAYGDGWKVLDYNTSTFLATGKAVARFYKNSYVQINYTKTTNADAKFLAVDIEVPVSGVYDLSVNAGYVNYAGGLEIRIDDKTIGSTIDLFDATKTGVTMTDIPVAKRVYLSAGTHRIKLVGKNSAGNTGDVQTVFFKSLTCTSSSDVFLIDFTTATVNGDSSSATRYLTHGVEAYGENWTAVNNKNVSTIMNGAKNATLRPDYLQLYIGLTSAPPRDTIAFKIQIPETDVYDVSLVAGFGNGSGAMDMYLDNVRIASKMDFYNTDDLSFREADVKKGVYLTSGEHTFKFVGTTSPTSGTTVDAYIKHLVFAKSTAMDVIAPEDDKVSFAVTTNLPNATPTVKSLSRGVEVDISEYTQPIEGFKFVGWKRGADASDENAWVDITGDSYTVWTNTYLTAIYEPVAEESAKVVEFWNQNGAYLGKATEATYATDVKRVPSLIGFGIFRGWFTDGNVQLTADTELKAGTTNAVAQYEDGEVSGVTLNGNAVTEANVYNKAIPFSASIDGFTCWKRDGKIISYDADYIHYVWDATAITEDDDVIADKTPVAILEYNAGYDAYMLEYDDGDYEIVEAGIIFGGDTVDSCTKKYTSQRKVSHNQFTVPAENGNAKGYIIWKDAFGAYRIDYYTTAQ